MRRIPRRLGERKNPSHSHRAHRSLAFGTKIKVTNMRNGNSVVVRVNDRGTLHSRRVFWNLSRGAANSLHMIATGTAKVCYEVLG